MPTIFDFINAQEIGTYYEETAATINAIPYLGEGLFPAKKQLGLELRWIKGANGLPVILKPSAFDAKATLRDRIGFKELITEMPFFREGMRIGEQDRQELNKAMAAANREYIMPLINKIYDDAGNLVGGAQAQAERMRMLLLYTGKIDIAVNRVNQTYDYNISAAHKATLTSTAVWSAVDTATPVSDIEEWMDKIEQDTGVRPTRAICTRKTFGYLRDNESIKKDMNPLGAANIITTEAMIKAYFQTKLNLTIAIYDKKYSLEDGTVVNFFADDYFTLIPDGALGNTFYGTTPEESDLMSGNTDAQVRIVNTGVAITTIKEPHPVNVQTIVSAIMLPTFPQAERIFIAKVN